MKRTVIPELLDTDAGTPAEIAAALADLRMVNRWFGGARVMTRLLARVAEVAGVSELSFLDAGAGSGDVARAAQEDLGRHGVQLSVTLLDRAVSHLMADENGLRRVVGDALRLPFADASFDVAGCSLFAHHLEPDQIVAFVNEGLRVARHAVLINDLRRHPMHLALVYAGMPLYRSRLTRHDGPVSIHRAYTSREMRLLLQRTRAARVEISHHYLFRMGAIAWRA